MRPSGMNKNKHTEIKSEIYSRHRMRFTNPMPFKNDHKINQMRTDSGRTMQLKPFTMWSLT